MHNAGGARERRLTIELKILSSPSQPKYSAKGTVLRHSVCNQATAEEWHNSEVVVLGRGVARANGRDERGPPGARPGREGALEERLEEEVLPAQVCELRHVRVTILDQQPAPALVQARPDRIEQGAESLGDGRAARQRPVGADIAEADNGVESGERCVASLECRSHLSRHFDELRAARVVRVRRRLQGERCEDALRERVPRRRVAGAQVGHDDSEAVLCRLKRGGRPHRRQGVGEIGAAA